MLPLPFEASTSSTTQLFFTPDGNRLVVSSAPAPGNPKRAWIVPIDGSAPRALETFSEHAGGAYMDLSDNGRYLVYTRRGAASTTLVKADYSALLKR